MFLTAQTISGQLLLKCTEIILRRRYHKMEITELYKTLEKLRADGYTVNGYIGCEEDSHNPDGLVLVDFIEYIDAYYSDEKPIWLETFYQVFMWQYNSMYEGATTYYSNFYGLSDYQKIVETGDFLKNNGYMVIAEKFTAGIVLCEQEDDSDAEDLIQISSQIEQWLDQNTKPVWDFYYEILEKHKNELLESQQF